MTDTRILLAGRCPGCFFPTMIPYRVRDASEWEKVNGGSPIMFQVEGQYPTHAECKELLEQRRTAWKERVKAEENV